MNGNKAVAAMTLAALLVGLTGPVSVAQDGPNPTADVNCRRIRVANPAVTN